MGVAVFDGQDLLYWGVAGFRQSGEELFDAVERRVERLAQTYQSEVIALEKPSPLRLAASWSLSGITNRISEAADRSHLRSVPMTGERCATSSAAQPGPAGANCRTGLLNYIRIWNGI